MSYRLRTPEQVCIAYADAVAEVRRLTAIIKPGECTEMASSEWVHGNMTTPIDPCISQLFSIKREDYDEIGYQEASFEIEEEMCDRCKESLEAVRERKVSRRKLSYAKRAVEAVGRRLKAAQA